MNILCFHRDPFAVVESEHTDRAPEGSPRPSRGAHPLSASFFSFSENPRSSFSNVLHQSPLLTAPFIVIAKSRISRTQVILPFIQSTPLRTIEIFRKGFLSSFLELPGGRNERRLRSRNFKNLPRSSRTLDHANSLHFTGNMKNPFLSSF